MSSQAQRVARFRALHERPGAFVIPNPWDIGTARILAAAGFEALATTSLGFANTLGRVDGVGAVSRDEVIAHCRTLAEATDLPLNADLENCYADAPKEAAKTIAIAADAGVAGASIEDSTGDAKNPIYDFRFAVERVAAAVEAAHARPVPILLTARAENYLHGRPDLDDTVKRLLAFAEAGADVLYAPGLASNADIATLIRSVDRPVNVLMGLKGVKLTVDDVSAIGAKRISVGSGLARCALGAFLRAARDIREHGSFAFAEDAVDYRTINSIFAS